MSLRVRRRLLLGALLALGDLSRIAVAAEATLWVVQPPGEVVAFDLSDFSRVGGIRIPPVAFSDPGRISINGVGQIMVALDSARLWLWDGQAATEPTLPAYLRDNPNVTCQWLLGNDRRSLYQVERDRRFERLIVRTTSLTLEPLEQILSIEGRPCETVREPDATPFACPDPYAWTPSGAVRDFFVLTRWEQTDWATCHTTLYRRGAQGWESRDLPIYCIPLLDAADGPVWIQAEGDEGCCGSSNSNSDVTRVWTWDTALVVFDEWTRFRNRNCDLSFYSASARIAPGGRRLAHTIHATSTPAETIAVSAEGHGDTLALAFIRRALLAIPMVEVHEIPPRPAAHRQLDRCELVGWVSDSEVLVVDRRRLVAVHVDTGRRRECGIWVRNEKDAWIVRR